MTVKRTLTAALALCIVLYLASFFIPKAHASTTVITGIIKDAQQNPINGTLVLQLPVPAVDTATSTTVSNQPIYYRLVNGVILGGASLPVYDVAGLQPKNLYYSANAYDTAGTLVFHGNYIITGASFNLGLALPTIVTTANVSYLNPVVATVTNNFTVNQNFTQITSLATNPAVNGFIRLAHSDTIDWRNQANSADLALGVNASDQLTFTGNAVGGAGGCSAGQLVQTINSVSAPTCAVPSTTVTALTVANSGGTGPSLNSLAKLVGAPSTATVAATTDVVGILGICISNCTNFGNSSIVIAGSTSCNFDGATTAGDFWVISTTVAGDCHDAGASAFSYARGQVLSTNGGAGTYPVILRQESPNTLITFKKGNAAGDYSTNSAAFVNVDGTNLAYTVTVPVGFKLAIQANGTINAPSITTSVTTDVALADGGTLLSSSTMQDSNGDPSITAFALGWVITGDGASHSITLQYKKDGGSSSAANITNNTTSYVPTMVFVLAPSN